MRLVSLYGLVCLFLFSMVTLYPVYVYAQTSGGSFVAYSFDYSGVKSGSGGLRLAVLDNFGNGTLRVEFSASMNNTDLSVKHNVLESGFHFPYVPVVPEFNQTLERKNVSVAVSVSRVADENVVLNGSTWVLNVSKVSVTVEDTRNDTGMMTMSLNGDLKVLAKSGLFYGFNGSVASGGNETQISIALTGTNLDLNVKPEFNISMLSQVGSLANLGMGLASFRGASQSSSSSLLSSLGSSSMLSIGESLLGSVASNSPASSAGRVGTSTASSTYYYDYYLLVAGLIGVVAFVSILSIRGLRRGRRTGSSEEKPLHWVH